MRFRQWPRYGDSDFFIFISFRLVSVLRRSIRDEVGLSGFCHD